jgi:MinD-like ATPase involved in chromosome partitioning or flagellar assembly
MDQSSFENVNNISVFGGGRRAADYIEEDSETPAETHRPPRVAGPLVSPDIAGASVMAQDVGLSLQNIPAVASVLPGISPLHSLRSGQLADGNTPAKTAESFTVRAPADAADFNTPESPNPVDGLRAAAKDVPNATAHAGIRGVLNRLGLSVKPSSGEVVELEREEVRRNDEDVVRQATWTRAVSVLVANPKGGTGKTPTALLLGGVLASIRGGSVAVIEVADDPGALNFRAEGNPRLGMGELVRDVREIITAGQLAGYTAPQTSFAAVIGSTGRRERLTGDAVIDVARVIDNFYSMRIMDSGNQPTSSAFHGAVTVADVLVVPVMNAGDSALEAIRLLDELKSSGGHAADLANTAIVIRLTDGRPENPAVAAEIGRLLENAGVTVVHEIPYDPHIADRGQITLAKLSPGTTEAFIGAASTVVRSLQGATFELTRKV